MTQQLPLSRTCNLTDFPGVVTVAGWQQALAQHAWDVWEDTHHIRTREETLCVNYAAIPFTAPGPSAHYQYREAVDNGVPRALAAVWGLGVMDRIDAPVRFLSRAAQILRPNGLLFLTFSCWDAEGDDCASGAAERVRIYSITAWRKLVGEARRLGLRPFGGLDWTYHGHKLGDDHTLASLVLTRRIGGEE